MSVRNLDLLLRPRSIALVGASDREPPAGLMWSVVMESSKRASARAPRNSADGAAATAGWKYGGSRMYNDSGCHSYR
jgi:hypothetical protein